MSTSFHLLDDRLQVLGHRRDRLAEEVHLAVAILANHEIERGEGRILIRVVLAEVPTALSPDGIQAAMTLVGAARYPRNAVPGAAACGEHKDRQVGIRPRRMQHGEAIEPRKHDVEDHEARSPLA